MTRTAASFATAALLLTVSGALADVSSINSVKLQLRRFNDYPLTTLSSTNTYPSLVNFHESGYPTTPGGFANQHIASFSADGGTTKYQFQNQDPFDIKYSLNLSVGSNAPRKEAGFRFDSPGGEGLFHVATDNGEVAAFGGFMPFFSFGNVYVPGTTVTLEMIYRPGVGSNPGAPVPATMEYKYNGLSSGLVQFTNNENGIINGTVDGLFVQISPNTSNPNEFADATFSNIVVTVPAPGTAGLLALAGLTAVRRRRPR
jgi:MYXO-CTERM domain-containing protein